ncbi:PKD domain-containing protein [Methanogenium cariaci]|jgi:PKD repeat protein|uniref:PKD domain-containing protein n=1 Tax=Methanogenium cariaci TaxID=2197 RepID=UPI0007815E08|nr:PKD domain-containing protein [Methanogenium cariaci]
MDTHTATLDGGNLTRDDAGCTIDEQNRTVSGCHVYTTPGRCQVTLTVTDDGGGSATRSAMISVTEVPTPEPTATQTPEPTETPAVPEFPIAVPSLLIVGFAGVVLLARRRQ